MTTSDLPPSEPLPSEPQQSEPQQSGPQQAKLPRPDPPRTDPRLADSPLADSPASSSDPVRWGAGPLGGAEPLSGLAVSRSEGPLRRDSQRGVTQTQVDGKTGQETRPAPKRWVVLPIVLFLLTCVSTFLAGAMSWLPPFYIEKWLTDSSFMAVRQAIVAHWQDGLIYMGCVLAILLTHEMGHFLATVRYRIAASFPFFLPFPISPLGTLGAVIRMDGMRANRKEIFDIGLAGPLAGLLVAVPITWIGIQQMDTTDPAHGPLAVHPPLILQAMLYVHSPATYQWGEPIAQGHLNPFLMAGWVGFLITGLNMLPVSQLDGGHVVYTLFLRRARWIARGFIVVALAYILFAQANHWWLMLLLVMLIGVDHPPTRDDSVPLGWFRTALGCLSLAIPLLCFAPGVMTLY